MRDGGTMIDQRGQPGLPTAFEMFEGLLLSITGIVVSAPVFPGFLLCVPALVLLTVGVILPLVAAAALVALVSLAGAMLVTPYLLVRSMRGRMRRRALTSPTSLPVPPYRRAPRTREESTVLTAGGPPA